MFEKFYIPIFSVLLMTGCASPAPDIRTLCQRDEVGNYLIKWEVDPPMTGTVKVYVSDNPDVFSNTDPVIFANMADGVATYVTRDNMSRSYFRLTFNDAYPQIVGSRALTFEYAQNVRDLGGYPAGDKHTRWGKVYRSGEFSSISERDKTHLRRLGIKTIIDLRGDSEAALHPMPDVDARIVHIPVTMANMEQLPELIREGRMRKRDALLYMQDQYLNFVDQYSEQFAEALSIFENPDNYPILFNCSLGKDRAGFLSTLLLGSLGVSEETILSDYTASSDYIDVRKIDTSVLGLDMEAQEAYTVLLSSSESLLAPTLQKISREYGSLDNYLSTKLYLTGEKRKKIKDIMLY